VIFSGVARNRDRYNQTPVITVIGKAFFDVGHSLKDQKSNRRSHLPGIASMGDSPSGGD
jgi:hypothetical protein